MAQALPLILIAASAATGAVGQIRSGIAARRLADAESRLLKTSGEVEAGEVRRRARKLMGAQRAAFAKAGISTTVGTPLDILGDTAAEAELEALRKRFAFRTQASFVKERGKRAREQAFFGAAGSLLSGGSKFAQAGGFGGTT